MTTMTDTGVTTQVYRVFIRATPEAIWDAITDPDFNQRYGYRGRSEYDLRPGGAFRADASPEMQAMGMSEHLLDGEVVEADPPRRLVQTWRVLWDPEMTAEGFTRLTWEIVEGDAGIATLTVTHELEAAPKVARQVAGQVPEAGGGWSWILSDLKTLLETGAPLAG
jgi:uncharacterized protein YndB with AHSA1/START domain